MAQIKYILKQKPQTFKALRIDNTKKYSDELGYAIQEALTLSSIPVISEKAQPVDFYNTLNKVKALYLSTHGVVDFKSGKYTLILNDSEISQYDLLKPKIKNSTQFIFVNACNSASSSFFVESLFKIGVETVIGSQWKNPSTDRATSNVVRRFYKNWRAGMPKLEALVYAQRETLYKERKANNDPDDHYRKNGDSPLYWAPFILVGDWR